MKKLKTLSFIMALSVAGAVCSTTCFEEPVQVSAIGILSTEINWTLEDDVFVINRGEVITLDDLLDHGLTVSMVNTLFHDLPEDPDCGKITKYEYELDASECKFDFPDSYVIGQNSIHVSYISEFGTVFKGNDIEITVNYFDNTINNKVNSTNDTAEGAATPEYGEINGDGVVDLSDLSELSVYLLRDKEFDDAQKLKADVDADGEISVSDLALMKQYVMGAAVKLGKR